MHLVPHVLEAAQALEKAAHRIFKPHRLTAAKFNVLSLLSEKSEGMRASDLAHALIVDPSNVTGLLKRMKKEGLVKELENLKDRRQHVVCTTPKGRSTWTLAHRDYEKNLVALDALLSPAHRTAAEKVLRQLIESAPTLP